MARQILQTDFGARILLVDSITEINSGDAGMLVISGSHGGHSAAGYAAAVPLAGCMFNDAGIGRDGAGVAGMLALSVPAIACGHMSARIGEPRDSWENGIVTTVNDAAKAAGVRPGMTVQAAMRLLAG